MSQIYPGCLLKALTEIVTWQTTSAYEDEHWVIISPGELFMVLSAKKKDSDRAPWNFLILTSDGTLTNWFPKNTTVYAERVLP